jgi:hypothetical protein
VKRAAIVAIGSIVLVAAIVVASYIGYRSSQPKGALKPIELTWIRQYYEWTGARPTPPCTSMPAAPTVSLRRVERLARAACRGEASWGRVERLIDGRLFQARPLPRSTELLAKSHIDPRLGKVVSRLARRVVEARCWSDDDWRRVNREFGALHPESDYWVIGLADRRGRVHFLGELCEPLVRFFGSRYVPSLDIDRAELAESLMILAHEAEHERDPSSSEAEVECYAVQHVRELVRGEGHSEAFAAEIASFAWDVSYLRDDPVYGTRRCRDGGPLDLHPRSADWP